MTSSTLAMWGQAVGSSMKVAPASWAFLARSTLSAGWVPARLAMMGTPAFRAMGISFSNHCSAVRLAPNTQLIMLPPRTIFILGSTSGCMLATMVLVVAAPRWNSATSQMRSPSIPSTQEEEMMGESRVTLPIFTLRSMYGISFRL